MPKAIASMCTAGRPSSSSGASALAVPFWNSAVRASSYSGTRMSTWLPRRDRMFCVNAAKRGCGLMTASGR